MDWQRSCAAVIPCFNEAAAIGTVVSDVKRFLPAVIVVDDGSTDGTAALAAAAGADVVTLKTNSGKGAAFRAGWRRAQELKHDWVLMLDGDGQHAAKDIPRFFGCADRTGADLVIGNRMTDAIAIPRVRRFINRWMSRRLSRITGVEIPDSQCGFRLAHLETLLRLPIAADRFEIESDMLVAFLEAGRRVDFVPVQTIYHQRTSKIHPFTDTWRWFRWARARRQPRRQQDAFPPAAPETSFVE